MGIQVEFNPDLALRDISEFKEGRRKIQECIPENLEVGKVYEFLKKGQRLYYFSDDEFWGFGQIPLAQAFGDGRCSRPLASIKFIEVTHFIDSGEVWTRGKYKVMDIFDKNDPAIHFEVTKRI